MRREHSDPAAGSLSSQSLVCLLLAYSRVLLTAGNILVASLSRSLYPKLLGVNLDSRLGEEVHTSYILEGTCNHLLASGS